MDSKLDKFWLLGHSVFRLWFPCVCKFCCHCCWVTKSCPTLCGPMDYTMPGSPVLHCLPESTHLVLCCPFLLLPSFFPQDQGLFPVSWLFLSSSGLHFHSTYNSTSLRKVIIDLLWQKRQDPFTQLLGCQFPCSSKQNAHFEISWLIQKNIQLNREKKQQHQFPMWIHELLLNMSVYLSGWSH